MEIVASWFSLEQNWCWFEDKLSSTTVDFIRSERKLKNSTLYGMCLQINNSSVPEKINLLQLIQQNEESTWNGDIYVTSRITITLFIQQVATQMQLLVCKTQAYREIPFPKDAFNYLRCWQSHPREMVYFGRYGICKVMIYPFGFLKGAYSTIQHTRHTAT